MADAQRIEIIRPSALTPADEAFWRESVRLNPGLSGPYFDIDYVRAIGPDVPNAHIARFSKDGRTLALFAYQIRSGVMQPMGAPLSDYHGVIAPPDVVVDFEGVLSKAGAKRLEFQGWVGPLPATARVTSLRRRHADVSAGFDAWWEVHKARDNKYFKNIARCQRNVEKDFGGFEFSWERVTPEVKAWIVALKRQQYKKSGMHDVFGCGWTNKVLCNLALVERDDFGLRVGVFRHEGKIVAAEISLLSGDEVHLWFPAYDPAYYRYSVGILLTVEILRHVSAQGVRIFDYGTGGEDYKSPTTSQGAEVFEGEVRHAFDPVRALLDRLSETSEKLARARTSFARRTHIVRATEVTAAGKGRALISLAQRAAGRLMAS